LKTAYLSLGSNLGDRQVHLSQAVEQLEKAAMHITRRSSIYETEPQDLRDQPWFLNQVIVVETGLSPVALLAATQKIENEMGRERSVPKGPRSIDIDILLYGGDVIKTAELEIPHPRLAVRRFVLEPLVELAPDMRHPVTNQTIRELLAATQAQKIR
jgi:2-amino-4-hydroxy-6-hydroxymethyldihydropteridine diphosphokinase